MSSKVHGAQCVLVDLDRFGQRLVISSVALTRGMASFSAAEEEKECSLYRTPIQEQELDPQERQHGCSHTADKQSRRWPRPPRESSGQRLQETSLVSNPFQV